MEPTKVCTDCKLEKPLSRFKKCFSGSGNKNSPGYAERNPGRVVKNRCHNCYALRYRAKLYSDFYDAMGRKCECCGEPDIRFLTLDHRNNDGNKHRETLQCIQIYMRARQEGFPKDKYAMLCYNCNCGRERAGGICPHQSAEKILGA